MKDNFCEELDSPDPVPVPTRQDQGQDVLGVEEGRNMGSKFWDRKSFLPYRRELGVVECAILVLGSLACHGW